MEQAFTVAKSPLHGNGVFAVRTLERGDAVGLAIRLTYGLWPTITDDLGRWVNHSDRPNAVLLWEPAAGGHVIRAAAPIPVGAEVLVDYRDSPWYVDKSFVRGVEGGGGGGGNRPCAVCGCGGELPR